MSEATILRRRDRKLAQAQRHLRLAHDLVVAALEIDANEVLLIDKFGRMDLARIADQATDGIRRIDTGLAFSRQQRRDFDRQVARESSQNT